MQVCIKEVNNLRLNEEIKIQEQNVSKRQVKGMNNKEVITQKHSLRKQDNSKNKAKQSKSKH